jgi:SulP family sulfate permease
LRSRRSRSSPTFAELYTPKLVTVFREGYSFKDFRADAVAGLTVAIVALPLSMATAIASGVGPERGIFTAIVGGFLVSALGGSRFQIGGPAGAFIVLIAAIVERHGYDGLVLATLVAGLILIAAGFLRLGTYIKYIPFPVTVGFTAGIAVIIFASQLKELLGLDVGIEPAAFVPKLEALWGARVTINPQAVAVGALALAVIVGLRKWRPTWPGFLIAVIAAGVMAWGLGLDVATIARVLATCRAICPSRHCRRLAWQSFKPCCPTRSPSRCLERSSRCCRRWWRTVCPAAGTAPIASWLRKASPMSAPQCSAAFR